MTDGSGDQTYENWSELRAIVDLHRENIDALKAAFNIDEIIDSIRDKMTTTDVKPELLLAIPSFSGTDPTYSVREFIDQIDDYAAIGNWPIDTICKIARRKLTGLAAEVFRDDADAQALTTWDEYKKFLNTRFDMIISPQKANAEFATCKQKEEETVDQYSLRLMKAAKRAEPTSSDPDEQRILSKHHELTRIHTFINGLKNNIREYVVLSNPKSYKEAVRTAREYEIRLDKGESSVYSLACIPQKTNVEKVTNPGKTNTNNSESEASALNKKIDDAIELMNNLLRRQGQLETRVSNVKEIASQCYSVCTVGLQQAKNQSQQNKAKTRTSQVQIEEVDENPMA